MITNDPGMLLDPRALDDADQLLTLSVGQGQHGGWMDVGAVGMVAWYHWLRYWAQPAEEGRADLGKAVDLFELISVVDDKLIPDVARPYLAGGAKHADPLADRLDYRNLHDDGNKLFGRALPAHDLAMLDRAIVLYRRALAISPDDDNALNHRSLGNALRLRHSWTGAVGNIEEAVDHLRIAVAATGNDEWRSNLGAALSLRFKALGAMGDLDEAIDLLSATAPEMDRVSTWLDLGWCLRVRFEAAGNLADLDAAVDTCMAAVNARYGSFAERIDAQHAYGNAVLVRFQHRGADDDVDKAVTALGAVVTRTAPNDPDYATYRSSLSTALVLRFGRTGDLTELNEAISQMRAAVPDIPASSVEAAKSWAHLGSALKLRAGRTGSTEDLDEAITALRAAVGIEVTGVERAFILAGLASALSARFDRLADLKDLNEAIETQRDAIEMFPNSHPNQALLRSDLGGSLRIRSAHAGSSDDLDEAISQLEWAASDIPREHPGRSIILGHLAVALRSRFSRTTDGQDIKAALDTIRQALAGLPEDHPNHANLQYDLGVIELGFAAHTEELDDLDIAIRSLRTAIAAVPRDDSRRTSMLSPLGQALIIRFGLTTDNADLGTDLNEGIQVLQSAVSRAEPNDPDLALWQMQLGEGYYVKYRHTGSTADLILAVDLLRAAAEFPVASVGLRLRAARMWATAAEKTGDADSIVAANSGMVSLLPLLAWRGLDRDDQERRLVQSLGLPSLAAAKVLAAGRPDTAIELLELGRGVLWSQVLDTRADMAAVHAVAPDVTDRLAAIRAELDIPPESTVEPAAASGLFPQADPLAAKRRKDDRRMALAREWDELINHVRRLPGLSGFLRPPRLADLRAAAASGTVVVINVSHERCDALCVSVQGLQVVPLLDLTIEQAVARANQFLVAIQEFAAGRWGLSGYVRLQRTVRETLEWLWESTMKPILDALGHTHTAEPTDRMWWCPTGPLTMLPLHAAGRHLDDGARDSVLDRVISSYTPTVRALLTRTQPSPTTDGQLLIVALPDTPGQQTLFGVADEVAALTRRAGDHCSVLKDAEATRARVISALGTHSAVHFACHGQQNMVAPSSNAVLLYDRPLTVLDISGQRLDHGQLAFLSACHTATGGVQLLDEAIHVTAALRLAGYRHVIGTLWSIGDRPAAEMADDVYSNLLRNGSLDTQNAAVALHRSVRRLRNANPSTLTAWAAYVHVGP